MRAPLTSFAAPLAAAVLFAVPTAAAEAQFGSTMGAPAATSGARIGFHGEHDRRHRRSGEVVLVGGLGYYEAGEWALYNNRSWGPGSYNDWWHDRPDRAYPRWLQTNRNCERVWWSGSGWRC